MQAKLVEVDFTGVAYIYVQRGLAVLVDWPETSVNDGEVGGTVAVGERHPGRERAGERVPIGQRAVARPHLLPTCRRL